MHALFDLDGTLTDSHRGISACIAHALAALGHPVPDADALRRFIGPPLHASFVELLGSSAAADQALALYRERFARIGLYENKVYAGVEVCLGAIAQALQSMYVVTSKPQIYARRIVAHFGLDAYFADVYGSELNGSLTDKGELIRLVLRTEALDPRATVMIGDRRHDIDGARANGVGSVGVLWGYGSRAELRAAGADRLCEAPPGLGDCLAAVLAGRDNGAR